MDEDNQQDAQNNQNILSADVNVNMEQLQIELVQAKDGWKRALADFENYKRRKENENKELVEFAREVTVTKLLPTLDSLEQALKHIPQYIPTTPSPYAKASGDTPPLKGGEASVVDKAMVDKPQAIEQNLGDSLPVKGEYPAERGEGVGDFGKAYQNWQSGVNGIVVQLDKTLEELGVKKIETIGKKFDPNFHEALREVESQQEDGIIVEEFQTGFELNGKVIRPSQVVISKKAT